MDAAVFDMDGTSPRDRFMLMLMDRVQALETSLSSLEVDAMTDSMSIWLDVDSLSDCMNSVQSMFGGSAMRGSIGSSVHVTSDWTDFAARFGQAIERIGGVDVSEVLVEHIRPVRTVRTGSATMQGGFASMDFGSMIQDVFDRVSGTKMFLTVRLRSKQYTASLERKLVQALDEQRDVKVNGSWRPTDVSAARLSIRNAVDEVSTWTWLARLSGDASRSGEHKHKHKHKHKPATGVDPVADMSRFASVLMAAMMTIGGGPAANHGPQ